MTQVAEHTQQAGDCMTSSVFSRQHHMLPALQLNVHDKVTKLNGEGTPRF